MLHISRFQFHTVLSMPVTKNMFTLFVLYIMIIIIDTDVTIALLSRILAQVLMFANVPGTSTCTIKDYWKES